MKYCFANHNLNMYFSSEADCFSLKLNVVYLFIPWLLIVCFYSAKTFMKTLNTMVLYFCSINQTIGIFKRINTNFGDAGSTMSAFLFQFDFFPSIYDVMKQLLCLLLHTN